VAVPWNGKDREQLEEWSRGWKIGGVGNKVDRRRKRGCRSIGGRTRGWIMWKACIVRVIGSWWRTIRGSRGYVEVAREGVESLWRR
jgi:hypothetical protein